ncbi:UNVERIFIED_CONTAM: hypothetical protein FKN15_052294 [Acipenser sinensis]
MANYFIMLSSPLPPLRSHPRATESEDNAALGQLTGKPAGFLSGTPYTMEIAGLNPGYVIANLDWGFLGGGAQLVERCPEGACPGLTCVAGLPQQREFVEYTLMLQDYSSGGNLLCTYLGYRDPSCTYLLPRTALGERAALFSPAD